MTTLGQMNWYGGGDQTFRGPRRDKPLWIVIGVSWAIAFFEYCLQVPANRMGSSILTAAQLKIVQEANHLRRLRGVQRALSAAAAHGL